MLIKLMESNTYLLYMSFYTYISNYGKLILFSLQFHNSTFVMFANWPEIKILLELEMDEFFKKN